MTRCGSVEAALRNLLPHVSAEVEQRQHGGNDEDWQALSVLEQAAIEALNLPADPDLFDLVLQYRNDLLHPVAPDSRERRLAAIDAAIAKVTGQ